MKTIALCLNHVKPEEWTNPKLGKKYPGAGWIPHFVRMAREKGYEVLGPKALKYARSLDTLVIQEELNPVGIRLLELGAKPQVFFCMESKMYAPYFYDALPELKKIFKHQLLFSGGTEKLYFPTYEEEDLKRDWPKWEDRKEICMIASNKQWWTMQPHWDSPSYCFAIRNELHTERLRAIEQWGEQLDLYGPGWDQIERLPPHWRHLAPLIQKIWKGPCEDKLETLAQYKQAICYENVAEPDYITEKPIDCFVTGTKPIYNRPVPHDYRPYSNRAFAETLMRCVET